jgi:hypothetical protein
VGLVAKLDDMVLWGRNRQDFSLQPEKLVCEFQTAAIVIECKVKMDYYKKMDTLVKVISNSYITKETRTKK